MKHKRNDTVCDHWDSQGDKNGVFISIAFCLDFLIRNENIAVLKMFKLFQQLLPVLRMARSCY